MPSLEQSAAFGPLALGIVAKLPTDRAAECLAAVARVAPESTVDIMLREAGEAALQLKFTPARRPNGNPFAARILYRYEFVLDPVEGTALLHALARSMKLAG